MKHVAWSNCGRQIHGERARVSSDEGAWDDRGTRPACRFHRQLSTPRGSEGWATPRSARHTLRDACVGNRYGSGPSRGTEDEGANFHGMSVEIQRIASETAQRDLTRDSCPVTGTTRDGDVSTIAT